MALVTSATSKTSSGFSPTTLPGCVLWLDAADSNTMTLSGSNITAWKDKSLSANHFTAIAGSPPVLSNYNSLNAISWTSTNQQLYSVSNNVTTGNATRTMFVAMHAPSSGGSQFFLVTGNESGGNPATAYGFGKNAGADYVYPFLYSSIGADVYSNIAGGITSNPTVLTSTFDGSNIIGWINGKYRVAKTTALNTTPGIWYLGKRQQNGTGSSGSLLLEVIQYSTELSADQRQLIEGYLSKKWGFASDLSAGYTYKTDTFFMRPFQPLDISGCGLWLDADDAKTLTFSGSTVTSWSDKSGNGYVFNTAPSGCSLPVLGNSINGRSTVGITNTSMGIKQTTVLNGVKNAFWIRRERTGNQAYEFYFGADAAADFHTGTSQYAGSGLAQNAVRDACLTLISSSGTTLGTPGTTNVLGATTVNIMGMSRLTGDTRIQGLSYDRGNTARSMQCDWGEVLLYTTPLTATQQTTMEGYLAWKWGIASYLSSNHPFRNLPPLTPVFTPLQIPGCALWFDAADRSSMTLSGSNVTQWNDKSGGGYHVTSGGTAPTYSATSNAVVFNGTGYFVNSTLSFPLGSRSVFLVCDQTSASSTEFEGILVFGSGGVTDYYSADALIYNGRGSNVTQNVAFSVFFNLSYNNETGDYQADYSNSSIPTPRAIYTDVFSGANGTLFVNGSNIMSDSTGGGIGTSSGFLLGSRNDGGNYVGFLNGRIYEVLVYNTRISASQRQQVEGYLANKWRLRADLSLTHPYKTITP